MVCLQMASAPFIQHRSSSLRSQKNANVIFYLEYSLRSCEKHPSTRKSLRNSKKRFFAKEKKVDVESALY
ncbi:unnamed protein product [Caenorhabditis angaria]|uniref:Uncharacterized protein n=1 Tax=Caenorhabditis angaria TaxID=860376 RepID=A0A9P1MUP2_9PELO|nr:unnamed protein product [Caenorhabditis angaria]